ncbi:MAG TPA: pyridoxine 5'-phosphate synthase [Xanthobacteraceae bacterium]|nr:pyridoxine 5'-phosphate synthase [Xanthobacteraceae bacterium]
MPADAAHNVRLGINVDHVATVRNARGGEHPDPVRAAKVAIAAGADGITAHLREDRRHITDDDIRRIRAEVAAPLNFEMAATEEMVKIALAVRPHAACLVPEKRSERTTEGGLDVAGSCDALAPAVARLADAGIRVSLFIEPDARQIEAAGKLRAPVVELHTGAWCDALLRGDAGATEAALAKLRAAAAAAAKLGIEVHAGHGLDFATAEQIAALPEIRELNIGHFLVGEALFSGFDAAIRTMRAAIARGRANAKVRAA